MASMQHTLRSCLLLCLVGAALVGAACAVPTLVESPLNGEVGAFRPDLETSPDSEYWEQLSEEEVENVLADDDSFDTRLFSSILDAIQHDKLNGQAALEEAARHAFEDGHVRHGRKINGQGGRAGFPSTDADAALLARSSEGAEQHALESASESEEEEGVEVQMRMVVGQLRLEMPWLHCMWGHVREGVRRLWGIERSAPVEGPRRHSLTKRHAMVASPAAPQEVQEQLDLLARSGFADEGDALFSLLRQFDSGDGESEELLPQPNPEPSLHRFNRKVKISVTRMPPKEPVPAAQWVQRWWELASARYGSLVSGVLVLVFVVSAAVLILSALQAEDGRHCHGCRSHPKTIAADVEDESDEESEPETEIKRVVSYTLHQ